MAGGGELLWVRAGLGLHEWSVEEYGRLLETGGGKERMMRYFLVRILGCKIAGYCISCLRHVSAQTYIAQPSRRLNF